MGSAFGVLHTLSSHTDHWLGVGEAGWVLRMVLWDWLGLSWETLAPCGGHFSCVDFRSYDCNPPGSCPCDSPGAISLEASACPPGTFPTWDLNHTCNPRLVQWSCSLMPRSLDLRLRLPTMWTSLSSPLFPLWSSPSTHYTRRSQTMKACSLI